MVPINRDSAIFARFVYDPELMVRILDVVDGNISLVSHSTIVRILLDTR